MNFIEMWEEADEIDAATGGYDSIPEWEYFDYVEAMLMRVGADIREHLDS